MVMLFCVIVGEARIPFSEQVIEDDSVHDLKKAIKVEKLCQFPADELQLFLAKTTDGAWLDGVGAAAVTLDEGGHLQDFEQMDPLLWINNTKYFGKGFQPDEGQAHVLVMLPKHLPANPKFLQLHETLLRYILMNEHTLTPARPKTFRTSLVQTYQCDMELYEGSRMVCCMLLNTALPSELVIASHLFRRKNEFICRDLMGFDNIDEVKNGLMLFKPLKHAYDHFQISFIYDRRSDEFHLKIFDPSLSRQSLFQQLNQNQRMILLRDDTLFKH